MSRLFPCIEISGTPFERGVQYGKACPLIIARSIEVYSQQLLDMGYDWAGIRRLVNQFVPNIEAFEPQYLEEMRGIAQGCGQDFEAIVLINARTEIIHLGRRNMLDRPELDGCTGAIILPGATLHNELLHGQNWDWRAECAETGVVLHIRREDGPDVLTFTEAGGLGRAGLNSIGTAITGNNLESDRDYQTLGVPLPLIRRKALEANHFALAMKVVAVTPKSGSNNMMLSHAGGFGINYECAPDEVFPLFEDNGLLVHANHWRSPVAQVKLKNTGIGGAPESFYRDIRVEKILRQRQGDLTLEHMKTAFFDDFGTPFAVCRPPRPSSSGEDNLSATVAMIVMRPASGYMEIAPLPAISRLFGKYQLEMESDYARYAVW
ncbi:peptidase C45 [Pseudomonas syringae]|uniref:Peptidase C45 n=1 Tax=Pseudomonas syringae TaxID=317 RepID=A0A1C7Z4D5_PSESX|nr:C45 family peptidase [Pseudomonas syringae]OCR23896.1 peptidase C45 [Pseudomonas syringae]